MSSRRRIRPAFLAVGAVVAAAAVWIVAVLFAPDADGGMRVGAEVTGYGLLAILVVVAGLIAAERRDAQRSDEDRVRRRQARRAAASRAAPRPSRDRRRPS